MRESTEDYRETLSGMREILFSQTRMIDAWLHTSNATEPAEMFKSGDPEVLRIVSTMIHMVGISAHSILTLTQEVGLQTRDYYSIARGIVESVVNIVFIMAQGREAAERADRHAQQKAYRDLKRESSAGGLNIIVGNKVKLQPEDEERLSLLAAEFTNRKGREKRDWTDENLTHRIDTAALRFSNASVIALHAAAFNIYRYSSEVLHGTYFSALHFWGLTTIGGPRPKSRDDLSRILSEHQFSVFMSAIFAFNALLECLSCYVADPMFEEHAKLSFDRLKELPLIRSALDESGDKRAG